MPQIPNMSVIASDIVIMHWHSIPALVGHKNVLLNQQHKHTDKLHLYAIKLRHLLTPKECFSRSAEAMVLIIQLRSERRLVVNEKYTDSDLCKVFLQMTQLTNSSSDAERTGTERERGPSCSEYDERTLFIAFYPSESSESSVGWMLTRSVGSQRSLWLQTLFQKSQLQKKTSSTTSAQAKKDLEQVERRRFNSTKRVVEFL